MQFLKTASPGARAALLYITLGAMLMIWTTVWYIFMRNHDDPPTGYYYICGGLFVSGITFMVIGLGIGRIGRSAKAADNSPAAPPPPGAPPVTTAQMPAVMAPMPMQPAAVPQYPPQYPAAPMPADASHAPTTQRPPVVPPGSTL